VPHRTLPAVAAPIVHVTPFLWSGAGAAVVRLAEAQRAADRVTVVTTGARAAATGRQRQRLRRAASRTCLSTYARGPTCSVVGGRSAACWQTADIIRHAGVPACALAICAIGAVARRRHRPDSWGLGRPAWMDAMTRGAWPKAGGHSAPIRQLAQLGVPRARLRYVPWGLDLSTDPQPRGTSGARAIVGSSAGSSRARTVAVVERSPGCRTGRISPRVRGPSPLRLRRRRAAAITGRTRRRRALTGPVSDVAPFLRRWCTFVSASLDEGQGLAVLEAMALGVPVVAAKTRGIEDYMDMATGVVVARATPAGLARGLGQVLARPGQTLARLKRARGLVVRRYRWSVALDALAAVYAGVLERD
jgi:hypothetical protein